MKEYKIKINGNDYSVAINDLEDNMANVSINGQDYEVQIEGRTTKVKTPKISVGSTTPASDSYPAMSSSKSAKAAPAPSGSGSGTPVKSPLPGVILEMYVKEGDTVKVGQRLLMLEAMKMENNIDSDKNGVIKSIAVSKGSSVLEGDVLLTIG